MGEDQVYPNVVDETANFIMIVGEPVSNAWKGWPKVFQIINKEFNVVVDEGVNELQARYYLNHYEQTKAQFLREGLEGLLGLTVGPDENEYH